LICKNILIRTGEPRPRANSSAGSRCR